MAQPIDLTTEQLVEIRASQRTFEGAYMRTALGQFSFSLILLKIFSTAFYPVGALFAVYGVAVGLVAAHRRHESSRPFVLAHHHDPVAPAHGGPATAGPAIFRTAGTSVVALTLFTLAAYVALFVLTWRLDT